MAISPSILNEKNIIPAPWCLDDAPGELLNMLVRSPEDLGSGSFAVVRSVNDSKVIKLTTCAASNVILPTLVNNPTPGLPMVFKDYGQVGFVRAKEGFNAVPIHAYLMENLTKPWRLNTLRKDRCPRGDGMRAKSIKDVVDTFDWLEGQAYLIHFYYQDAPLINGEHPYVQRLSEVLHETPHRPLVNITRRLSKRVVKGEWSYDWLDHFKDNVMVSQWGELILADPVYSLRHKSWKRAYWEYFSSDDYS